MTQMLEGYVYWAEVAGRRSKRDSLYCAPIEINDTLKEMLFSKLNTAILTSATLSTGGNFEYLKS
ncbi:MAG: hypothetical protein ABH847_00105, partial [Candidatus Omnitrophota bacterium]